MDAHAIRLHDDVAHKLVVLLQSLGLAVSFEPIGLFADLFADDNRRPDIFIYLSFSILFFILLTANIEKTMHLRVNSQHHYHSRLFIVFGTAASFKEWSNFFWLAVRFLLSKMLRWPP